MFGLPLVAIAVDRAAHTQAVGWGIRHVHAPTRQALELADGGRAPACVHRPGARCHGGLRPFGAWAARADVARVALDVLTDRQAEVLGHLSVRQNALGACVQGLRVGRGLTIGVQRPHRSFGFLQPRVQSQALPLGMRLTLHDQTPFFPRPAGLGVRLGPDARDRQAEP